MDIFFDLVNVKDHVYFSLRNANERMDAKKLPGVALSLI